VPDGIEVQRAPCDVVEIDVGEQDLLAVPGRPGQDLP